ncbi:MAG: hypothetical protein DVB33_08770 [Verrucomicrobia bacterium]|jgi:hypothetical protein|nr:MAG: hypothetical protein DVB33_08770 [Verrucomicrobiota bacterium]
MSARKITNQGNSEQLTVNSRKASLALSPDAVSIHKGGIEFRSEKSFPIWVEMTVTLQSHNDGAAVNCTGVVVGCSGNKHAGYQVSMVFTSMTKQAEARLDAIVYSRAG